VTFGANALVDMPAAFHVSSARQLNFANGVVFKAGNGADSTLSIAAPTSFGFLGSEADVKLQGMGSNQSPFLDMDQSTVASLFDVTARSIDFDGSALGMRLPSNSTASSPSVRLAATGSHLVDLPLQGLPNAPSMGSITLASSHIGVHDEDAVVSRNNVQTTRPMIILSGGPIAISDTFIQSEVTNPGAVEGAGIDIRAGQLTIARSTITTLASAYTSAVGGAINIAAHGDVEITGIPRQGGILTEGFGFGAAGDIKIQAQNLSLGTDVRSSGLNGGVAGSIHILVGDKLILRDAAKIDVSSSGNGTDIEIHAADMRIAGGGIYNRTLSSGRAGNITITADDSITVDYPGIFIVSNSWAEDPASIVPAMLSVDAQRLLLRDNARIAAISTGNVPTDVVLRVGQEIHETHDPIQFDSSWGRRPRLLHYSDDAALYYGGAIGKFGNNGDLRTVLGKIYTVQETDGSTAGANLFHSFARFSVGAGDAVVFTTNTYSLQNVIARVTGGAASVIDGLLMLDPVPGSRPNFFLINPSGIVFGAGAVVDMPAAFHASTASRLIFGHDAMLVAGAPDSVSIASEPSAFGFMGGEAGIAMRYVINGGRGTSAVFPGCPGVFAVRNIVFRFDGPEYSHHRLEIFEPQ
jgi:filamentous hemagglutinin family protein